MSAIASAATMNKTMMLYCELLLAWRNRVWELGTDSAKMMKVKGREGGEKMQIETLKVMWKTNRPNPKIPLSQTNSKPLPELKSMRE